MENLVVAACDCEGGKETIRNSQCDIQEKAEERKNT